MSEDRIEDFLRRKEIDVRWQFFQARANREAAKELGERE